jgi:FkbM family methyltransferase
MASRLFSSAKKIVERVPAAATLYRKIRDARVIAGKPKQTPLGFIFAGYPSMQNGEWETQERELVERIIPQIDVFINIGANIGYYCCIARQLGARVVAFEPIHVNVEGLLKNVKANGFESRVEVYPIALTNNIGIMEMYGGSVGASLVRGYAPKHYVRLVSTTTLDTVLGSRFGGQKCFVLMDVEGSELPVLEGATEFLDRTPKPLWMVEIVISRKSPDSSHNNPQLLRTFEVFWDHGYEAWTAEKDCRLVSRDQVQEVVKTGIDTIKAYNFLFLEKGRKEILLGG